LRRTAAFSVLQFPRSHQPYPLGTVNDSGRDCGKRTDQQGFSATPGTSPTQSLDDPRFAALSNREPWERGSFALSATASTSGFDCDVFPTPCGLYIFGRVCTLVGAGTCSITPPAKPKRKLACCHNRTQSFIVRAAGHHRLGRHISRGILPPVHILRWHQHLWVRPPSCVTKLLASTGSPSWAPRPRPIFLMRHGLRRPTNIWGQPTPPRGIATKLSASTGATLGTYTVWRYRVGVASRRHQYLDVGRHSYPTGFHHWRQRDELLASTDQSGHLPVGGYS